MVYFLFYIFIHSGLFNDAFQLLRLYNAEWKDD
jgi:hypothetical protein